MKRKWMLALCILFGLLVSAGSAQATGPEVIITGYFDQDKDGVRDAAEPEMTGVYFTLKQNGRIAQGLVSSYDGSVTFGPYPPLPPGAYTVQGVFPAPGNGILEDQPMLTTPEQTVTATEGVQELEMGLTFVPTASDGRYFPQTGFRIDSDRIWDYFQSRGGVDTFGYPISHTFLFRNFWIQIFQRHVIQIGGGGDADLSPRPLNLLDPDVLPITRLNGSTFPAHNPQLAAQAPAPNTPNYGQAVQQHLSATVPNQWEGQPLNFLEYYLSAAPASAGPLRPLVALEIWGFPTSHPARDPNNHNFIYQRFQRGILHYDTATGVTRGILLGDAFKQVLLGQNLPPDLAADTASSPFRDLYLPTEVNALAREVETVQPAVLVANTNLAYAFTPLAATEQ